MFPARKPQNVERSSASESSCWDLKRRFEELNWVRAVRSVSPSWRAPYAVSPGRYSATAGSALWSLRISFQLLREFSGCRRPTRKSLEDNLALAVVQHLQKLPKFVAHVLV